MTPDHYQTLRVLRGAEGPVIRAAYRALVRLYHPDRNPSPHAKEHLQEITAAYAVLSDPIKRATYDSIGFYRTEIGLEEHDTPDPNQRSSEPMPEAGFVFPPEEHATSDAQPRARGPRHAFAFASAALALGVILVVAVGLPTNQLPRQQQAQAAAPISTKSPVQPPTALLPEVAAVAELHDDPSVLQPATDSGPAPSRASAQHAIPRQSPPDPLPTAKREIPQVAAAQAATPKEGAPKIATANVSPKSSMKGCSQGSRTAGSGQCTDDRPQTVEQIAKGYLRQSMEHADRNKQQLLLSARSRAATSRKMCRTEKCTAEAYLRQIREISAIMEGRRPVS